MVAEGTEWKEWSLPEVLKNKTKSGLVPFSLEHRSANVFSKESDSKYSQLVNIFSFVGYMVSVVTTQLCLCNKKQPSTTLKEIGMAVLHQTFTCTITSMWIRLDSQAIVCLPLVEGFDS